MNKALNGCNPQERPVMNAAKYFVLKRMECCQQQIKIETGSKDMSWHWLVIVMPTTKPSEDEVRHKLKSKGIEHNAVSWVWAWG